jgi:hypothetical protein
MTRHVLRNELVLWLSGQHLNRPCKSGEATKATGKQKWPTLRNVGIRYRRFRAGVATHVADSGHRDVRSQDLKLPRQGGWARENAAFILSARKLLLCRATCSCCKWHWRLPCCGLQCSPPLFTVAFVARLQAHDLSSLLLYRDRPDARLVGLAPPPVWFVSSESESPRRESVEVVTEDYLWPPRWQDRSEAHRCTASPQDLVWAGECSQLPCSRSVSIADKMLPLTLCSCSNNSVIFCVVQTP